MDQVAVKFKVCFVLDGVLNFMVVWAGNWRTAKAAVNTGFDDESNFRIKSVRRTK